MSGFEKELVMEKELKSATVFSAHLLGNIC